MSIATISNARIEENERLILERFRELMYELRRQTGLYGTPSVSNLAAETGDSLHQIVRALDFVPFSNNLVDQIVTHISDLRKQYQRLVGAESAGVQSEIKMASEALSEKQRADDLERRADDLSRKLDFSHHVSCSSRQVTVGGEGCICTSERRAFIAELKTSLDDWKRTFNMYRSAWLREIGGVIRNKSHEIDGFVGRTRDIYQGYQAAIDELRVLRRIPKGEVWYWQGDGTDFPDSLTCPVIMTAQTLRKLLAGELTRPRGHCGR